MKKTILTLSALLLACLAFYGWHPFMQQPSTPQMQSFYNKSIGLGSVSPDSVSRFVVDYRGYTMLNPRAKLDPLYSEIESNIQKYVDAH